MVGVERIKEYQVYTSSCSFAIRIRIFICFIKKNIQEIPEEAPLHVPGQDPPDSWPEHGVVEFRGYQTRYREGLDLVLRGIDCTIRAGEKVRTFVADLWEFV